MAPTCPANGVRAYTCSRCPATNDITLFALGHTTVADPAVAVTCTQTGLTAGSHCSVCGAVLMAQTAIPATGHSYAAIQAVEPTCTEAGYTLMRCKSCGDEIKADPTGKLGHLYAAWTPDGQGNHTETCTRPGCGHTVKVACAPISAVIGDSSPSACLVCGGRFASAASLEEAPFTAVAGTKAEVLENGRLPRRGELTVRYADAPLGTDANILRLYTVAFGYGGRLQDFTGPVRVTIPIQGELPPFRLVFIHESGEQTELKYELTDGMLSFVMDAAGVFAMMAL